MNKLLASVLLTAGTVVATTVTIPYTSGKLAHSQAITLHPALGTDSLRVGEAFTLRFYAHSSPLTVCGAKGTVAVQVLTPGVVERHPASTDTSWMQYDVYPSAISSMARLDSIQPDSIASPAERRYPKAPGYVIARPGEYNDCMGATYDFGPLAKRVIFVRNGNVYAKVKIVSHVDSAVNPTPSINNKWLTRVTVRMIVNTSPSSTAVDLVDPNPPVALGPALRAPGGKERAKAFYSPLGVRLEGERPAFSPALPRR